MSLLSRLRALQPENLISPFVPVDGAPPQSLWRFIGWAVQGTWPIIFLAGVISALAGGSEALTAYFLGAVVDAAVEGAPEGFISRNSGTLLAFFLFFLVARPLIFGLSSLFNSVVVAPNIMPMVTARLNRWSLSQSVGFFDDDFAGRIAQKQMQTARAVTDTVVEMIHVVAFALASLIGSLLLLLTIDGMSALVLMGWLVVYFATIRYFLPRVKARSGARANSRAAVTGQIVDTITNIKTVKLFAHGEDEDKAALTALAGFRETSVIFGRLSALFRLSLMTVAGMLPVLLIGASLLLWANGAATAGDITATGAISIRISQMTGWVSFSLMGIYAQIGEVEDGMRTLAPDRRLLDVDGAEDLRAAAPVAFEGVSFAYPESEGHSLHDISFTVAEGEKIGLVGPSGAGKSTLVALLLRLYSPQEGVIRLGPQDIAHVTQDSLRRQIGMVTQDTAMFNRSARDNIAYGRKEATQAEVEAAARRAAAHDFILGLRDHKGREGYDAHLGERGVKLSGGQRQRIALARVILKDAPLLVLDEATSALDSESEALIQSAFDDVMRDKTVIAIAHRLSTLAHMDRILVLDGGRIVEEGTHQALLAKDGLYASLWAHQSGGFLGAAAE